MKTKRYLLTDFTIKAWENIDMESVKNLMPTLIELCENNMLYGQIGNPESSSLISLSNSAFVIKNILLEENKIYGDVEFLDNKNGKDAFDLLELCNAKFKVNIFGIETPDEKTIITNIFQWHISID